MHPQSPTRTAHLRHLSDLAAERFLVSLTRAELETCRYNPDQPRVPAGQPGGGQWGSGGEGGATSQTDTGAVMMAARQRRSVEAFCERQYERDIFQCNMVGLRACYRQAMERLAACLAGRPIPPFNY